QRGRLPHAPAGPGCRAGAFAPRVVDRSLRSGGPLGARAWDMAFYSLRFGPGDRILTSAAEYASNYIALLQTARRTGAVLEVVPGDATGQVSVEALERMIDSRVKLIALTHIPTNGGLVNPARAVGAVARRAGIPFLLDACPSVGQV